MANFTKKRLCWSLFLKKLPSGLKLYKKETPTQVFSNKICEISAKYLSLFFEEYLRTNVFNQRITSTGAKLSVLNWIKCIKHNDNKPRFKSATKTLQPSSSSKIGQNDATIWLTVEETFLDLLNHCLQWEISNYQSY